MMDVHFNGKHLVKEQNATRNLVRPGRPLPGLLLALLLAGGGAAHAQQHGIAREVFTGITGASVADLINHPSFPDNPTSTNLVTDFFEAPTNIGIHYGQRMHGYIIPPQTGNYRFWIASDDGSVLLLSTNADPANVVEIASVPGWTPPRQWDRYSEQQSSLIHLQADNIYYIAALQKEHEGGDNLAVRWQLPSGTMEEPIPATRMYPYGTVFGPPEVAQHPQNITAVEGGSATFSVTLADATPATFQWQRNLANIPGATSATYVLDPVQMSDDGARFRVRVRNDLGTVFSSEAVLSVTPDTTPPELVEAWSAGTTGVALTFSEPVETASATRPDNYQIDGGITVNDAAFGADQRTIILSTSTLSLGQTYTLTVNNVRDRAMTPNTISPDSQIAFVALDFTPADVGEGAGSIAPAEGGYDVSGAGSDIGGNADEFHFSHQQRTGNFDVKVRVAGMDNTHYLAKAGLMARENLSPNSRFAAALATPSLAGNIFAARTTAGSAPALSGGFPANFPHNWLRLRRNGNTFQGFASYDGKVWHSLGSATISLPSTLYFGLAVTSRDAAATTTAQFRDMADATGETISTLPPRIDREPLGPSSRRTGLVISEIMYHPAPREDERELEFVEIYNSQPVFEDLSGFRLTGAIGYTFPQGTILPAGAFLVVAKSPEDVKAVYGIDNVIGGYSGSLQRESGTVRLRNRTRAILLEVEYSAVSPWPAAAARAGHSLVLARPTYGEGFVEAWAASSLKGGSPGGGDPIVFDPLDNIMINEFLAHTDEPLVDFIELYNHSNETVDLSGAFLSDRPHINKFQIPAGTTIAPRGFVVVDELELGFALSAAGEAIYFTNPDNTRVIDAITFDAQANAVSMGRFPDGAPDFHLLSERTPGASNAPLLISDVVINEIMFNHPSGFDEDTYLELYNRGDEPVDVSDWRFVDGISFTIPDGTVIQPGAYLVIAKDRERLIGHYPQLNASNTLGNFGGRLSNSGERLALAMPVHRTVGGPNYVVVDEVTYRDGGRWGDWINRGGSSLELIDPRSDSRRSSNWTNSDERNKSEWVAIEHTGLLDHGQGTADELHILMPSAGICLIDNVEVFVQGGPNMVPNGTFEAGTSGWIWQGNHVRSGWHTAEGYNSNRSLRVQATGGGDNGANRIKIKLNSALSPGSTATIRARGRWLAGHTNVILRLKGNYLEAVGNLTPPQNLGTPGQPNTAYAANAGPAIYDVTHHPVLPAASQPVTVTARVHDPDGISSVTLRYRVDPSGTLNSVTMRDDGQGGDAVAGDGVYTAVIPGQSSGTLVAFRIQATDGHAPSATSVFPEAAPAVEALVRFGESDPFGVFGTYRMWFTQATINEWSNREGLSNQRLPGTFVYGSRVIHEIGARFRGSPFIRQGASNPFGGTIAYSFQVPRDDLFLGTREFNLDGLEPGRDNTSQRERMSFWIGNQLDVPFSHQAYIYLFLNGVRRGQVYADSQHIDSDYVRAWYPDDDEGDLHKIDDWFEFNDSIHREFNVDARLQDFTTTGGVKKKARYRWNWNRRSNRGLDDDYSSLFALVDAVNTPGTDAYTAAIEAVVDVEQWMRVFAVRRIVADWDGYGYNRGKNMWTYKPTQSGWKMLLWDLDFSLGGGSDGPTTGLFHANDPTMVRMYEHPPFRRAYLRAFHDAVYGALLPENMHPVMDANYAAFQDSGINVTGPGAVKSWVEQRRAYIIGQLNQAAANFAITSNSGNNFSTAQQYVTLEGTAPVSVRTITVNGVAYAATWTGVTAWRVRVPLEAGANALVVEGWDSWDNPVEGATRSITVTFTGSAALPEDHLVINEIMYNPAVPDTEFVEIHNTSTTHAFDLTGYRLRGIDFNFAPGTVIESNGFLVMVKDHSAFVQAHGAAIPIAGVYNGRLDPEGERLRLVRLATDTGEERIMDEVTYGVSAPWPPAANGLGPSLQRIDPTHSSSHPGNWAATFVEPINLEPQTFLVITNMWKYDQSGVDLGTQWRMPGYNDSAWPSGRALLYVESAALPAPKNTPLTLGRITYYFRTTFTNPVANANGIVLTTRTIIDDGAVFYLNGQEVFRLNMPPGPITYSTFASSVITTANWQGPFALPADVLVPGENVMAVEVHQVNPNSSDIVFGMTLEAEFRDPESSTPGAPNSVRGSLPPFPPLWINEIQPNNLSTRTDSAGEHDPWIELYNAGEETISLQGYHLTYDFDTPAQWAFPSAASIGPGEFRIVWLDAQPEQGTEGEWHANFRIDAEAGSVFLMRQTEVQPVVVDYIHYSNVAEDWSYGRFPDGAEHRQIFHVPTPGETNDPTSVGVTVFINEWMASNAAAFADAADGEFKDWFELYNPGTGAVDLSGYTLTDRLIEPDRFTIPNGTVVPGGGFLLVWADGKPELNGFNDDIHANFSLSMSGEAIGLFAPDGSVVDTVTFGPQTTDVSQGRWPDGAKAPFHFLTTPTPGAPNYLENPPDDPIYEPGSVLVNEWMADNATIIADPTDGEFKNWFELYNPGTEAIDLSGYTISDKLDNPTRWTVPDGTVIGAGGFLFIWADGKPELMEISGGLHTNFSLSRNGEAIGIYAPDGTTIDVIIFGPQETDISQGRWPDGNPAPLHFFTTPTPGAPNVLGTAIQIVGAEFNAEGFSLSWSTVAGARYRVEYTDSLSDPAWIDLAGELTADGSVLSIVDEGALTESQRYYRILRLEE